MTRSIALSIPALTLVLALGCQDEDEGTICTDQFVSSVVLSIADEAGDPIDTATATYAVDGGAPQDCVGEGAELVCGGEEAGEFEIIVDGFGYGAETIELTVGEDECHVIQELVDVTLYPVACTEEEVPSVIVTVVDDSGEAVTTDIEVAWNMDAEDDLPDPCFNVVDNEWACAGEVSGDLAIEVDATGYLHHREVVTVGFDECHVITEDILVELTPDT